MSHINLSKNSCKTIQKIILASVISFFLAISGQVFGADILFITGTKFSESDLAIQNKLESRSFSVTLVQGHDVQIADALDKDLVIISESVYSPTVQTTFRNLPVPVIVSEPWLFSDMGMTGSNYFTDFGKTGRQSSITINDSSHDLAAGLTGIVSISYRKRAIGWGAPGADALKIATLDHDPDKCTIFAYQKGDQMPGMVAPAKRVGFFLYWKTASYLTPQGWALFDAALDWALAPQPPIPVIINVVSDDSWKTCAGEGCENPGWQQFGFADSYWMNAYDAFPHLANPEDRIAGTEAEFIWFCPPGADPESASVPSVAYFRKIFNIPAADPADLKVIHAYVASPGPIDLYINGTRILEKAITLGEGGSGRPIDIGRYLVDGDNVLAIFADNGASLEKWILLDAKIEALVQPSDNAAFKNALLVTGKKRLRSSDREIKTRLEQSGYLVSVVDDRWVEEADSYGMDLIVISESVWSAAIGDKLTDVTVPIICFDSYLYDDLRMTGARPNRDYGNAYRQKSIAYRGFPGHPAEPAAKEDIIQVTTRRRSLGWGMPSESAVIIATLLHDPTRAVIFAYEKDAPMAGDVPAPAKRIGMFPHHNTASRFTEAGWALFDAAVTWATE